MAPDQWAGTASRTRKSLGLALWGNEPVQRTASQVRMAEDVGFDSVWLVDSQLICREAYVTLAACATQTSRIKLATGVTVPRTRHPSVMASAFATLQELSEGRMILGIGTGNSSLRTLGQEPAKIAEIEAYLGVVRALLDNEAVRFDGTKDAKITWMDRPSGVPVYVAATGPRLTRAAPRLGDGVVLLQGISPGLLSRALTLVSQGATDAGRSPASVDVVCWVYLGISVDGTDARDHVRGRVAAALKISNPEWFDGEEREIVRRLQGAYDYFKHASANPDHAAIVPDRLVDQYAIVGTPAEIRERVRELMAQPGFTQIVLSPQVSGHGSLPIETVLRVLERDVLTHLG